MEINKSYDTKDSAKAIYDIYRDQVKTIEQDLYQTLKDLSYQFTDCNIAYPNYTYVADLFNECIELSKRRERLKRERDRVEKELISGVYEDYYDNITETKNDDESILGVIFKNGCDTYYATLSKKTPYDCSSSYGRCYKYESKDNITLIYSKEYLGGTFDKATLVYFINEFLEQQKIKEGKI